MHSQYRLDLASLTIYRALLDDPTITALIAWLDGICAGKPDFIEITTRYHQFCYQLFKTGRCFSCNLRKLILEDDNIFSRTAEQQGEIYPELLQPAIRDLALLQRIACLDFAELAPQSGYVLTMPPCACDDFHNKALLQPEADWSLQIDALVEHYQRHSRGLMSIYRALRWDAEQGLEGIACPHLPQLNDLIGYEQQKQLLCRNTEQFLAGFPANNVLLYGSSGTGKSTMIKALLSHYQDQPLRMVEVRRDSLYNLHHLAAHLRSYVLKFILFIDDLSFEEHETEYKGLKAILEGSLQGHSDNVLVYATSNRRHLVREFFRDRERLDDEIHVHDTQQEKGSLADRFGLTVTFPAPVREEYLAIVEGLAQRQGLSLDPGLLRGQALQWERSRHGPSGRTAQQFVNYMAGRCGLSPRQR